MSAAEVRIFTIGFTKKTAEEFFDKLAAAGVRRVVDVRLNNISQLAGFSKKDDLRFFLSRIDRIDYVHVPEMAPTQEMLDGYKKLKGDWAEYERQFLDLMARRRIESTIPRQIIDQGCLLCSEDTPDYCHRRLVAEYLARHWEPVRIIHIL